MGGKIRHHLGKYKRGLGVVIIILADNYNADFENRMKQTLLRVNEDLTPVKR